MSALTVDLMGFEVMDEATIQARAQDIINSQWPAWQRERALRLGDVAALNAFMADISVEVDLARENSALLAAAIAYERAEDRLALPAYDGPLTVEQTATDGTVAEVPHPDKVKDDTERTAALDLIAGASLQVQALVTSRIPPEPEPEPEPMVLP